MASKQKIIIVGAGPVGSLAALYAAKRGHEVEVYELRDDLRKADTNLLNFSRSINLALSERGINGLRQAGHDGLLDHVMSSTIPMTGRMIHGRKTSGELFQEPQEYDAHGRTIYAIDRAGLNSRLLDILEKMPNVTLFFQHKLTGANFKANKAWFEVGKTGKRTGRAKEIEVNFDLMIGADGAHSAVRYHMMKYVRMDYHQEYIDALWCEFRLDPWGVVDAEGNLKDKHKISPNHLHIWPGKEFMFIAIPSLDGSFTCTLFMPSAAFALLEAQSPSTIPTFFNEHFPGVTRLIPAQQLIDSFSSNPHLPLISIKCAPYHFASSAVIIGDAAHAMVPFYGQGMNAGFEDVRILFDILDKHSNSEDNNPLGEGPTKPWVDSQREAALREYSEVRTKDAHAINDLALGNYVEMRSGVLSRMYRLRKFLEEKMSVYFPNSGWQTKYARVSFGNERYSEVIRRTEYQGKVLLTSFLAAVGVPVLVGSVYLSWRSRRMLGSGWKALTGWLGQSIGQRG